MAVVPPHHHLDGVHQNHALYACPVALFEFNGEGLQWSPTNGLSYRGLRRASKPSVKWIAWGPAVHLYNARPN